jgi:hypothetical protein
MIKDYEYFGSFERFWASKKQTQFRLAPRPILGVEKTNPIVSFCVPRSEFSVKIRMGELKKQTQFMFHRRVRWVRRAFKIIILSNFSAFFAISAVNRVEKTNPIYPKRGRTETGRLLHLGYYGLWVENLV